MKFEKRKLPQRSNFFKKCDDILEGARGNLPILRDPCHRLSGTPDVKCWLRLQPWRSRRTRKNDLFAGLAFDKLVGRLLVFCLVHKSVCESKQKYIIVNCQNEPPYKLSTLGTAE